MNQLKSPYVFGRRVGDIRESFTRAAKRAGIKECTFHTLRHTFASHLIMRGVSLNATGELLGHADIKTTMTYAHPSQEHLKNSVNLLNDLPGIRQGLETAGAK
jgi:site-specific recombinase XerD